MLIEEMAGEKNRSGMGEWGSVGITSVQSDGEVAKAAVESSSRVSSDTQA